MSKLSRIATPLIAVAMMSSVPSMLLAQATPAATPTQASATQASATQDWNTPPAGTEQAQQGYRDGITGAKLDKLTNRKIGATTSHQYLHPPVKSNLQADYRTSFIVGYEAAVKNGASYPTK
jgi:hypothetical protein